MQRNIVKVKKYTFTEIRIAITIGMFVFPGAAIERYFDNLFIASLTSLVIGIVFSVPLIKYWSKHKAL